MMPCIVARCALTLAMSTIVTSAFGRVPRRIVIDRHVLETTTLASSGGRSSANDKDHDGGAMFPPPAISSELESLLSRARHYLDVDDADGAFATLAEAYGIDPTSADVSAMFERCLSLRVEMARFDFHEREDGPNAMAPSAPRADERDGGDGIPVSNVVPSERRLRDLFQDRVGLSSLMIDRERYDEAGVQLRRAIDEATHWLDRSLSQSSSYRGDGDYSTTIFDYWQPRIDGARYLLHRTDAACCRWGSYFADGDRLRRSLLSSTTSGPSVHPFDALKFPCISLDLASDIARDYARRALLTVGVDVNEGAYREWRNTAPPRAVVTAERCRNTNTIQRRRMRIGYLSPDFTSRHPLAFLMQHVFRHHDRSHFVVCVYSLSRDDGPEVRAIRESSDVFAFLSPSAQSPVDMYRTIMQDELDVLVDLCGYAGTSIVSEIMASRCRLRQDRKDEEDVRSFPIHVSYMGFPGSCGSSLVWDYSVFDPIVVPPDKDDIRGHYEEALVYLPHSYFVNSHKTAIGGRGDEIMAFDEEEKKSLRSKYGIRHSAFVYCCHSRPDKIDPSTFRSWMRAITLVRSKYELRKQNGDVSTAKGNINCHGTPVLWMLRSGDEMEKNVRRLVRQEFGKDLEECLVFADVVERKEHLRRLGIADVFLDTPAYNAHTLGCDALYMGVPMISLLRKSDDSNDVDVYSGLDLEFADVDSGACTSSGQEMRSIATEKLSSRVGASLLKAVGLEDLICEDMAKYAATMARCALDEDWFSTIRRRLLSSKDSSPLFDTKRWVENLEGSFRKMAELGVDCANYPDIVVRDDSYTTKTVWESAGN
ncbi:hypothetical protein ACHAXA_003803 [Cyclostephanos tholiformis]|uniref:O-GlcNAc transferase C-terminal domain-containing protein n=1 Tax=Cyclostephanos tholiformis TaxID=382380 RepID=A0ABD3RWG0_9STRA